jgi:hypothetical protein
MWQDDSQKAMVSLARIMAKFRGLLKKSFLFLGKDGNFLSRWAKIGSPTKFWPMKFSGQFAVKLNNLRDISLDCLANDGLIFLFKILINCHT